jgi:predicted ATPase
MIERIEVSNFRSIGPDQILELGPLTALVGTNASGKSSLLKAFTFMADTLRLGLEGAVDTAGGMEAVRRWAPTRPLHTHLGIKVEEPSERTSVYYKFSLEPASGKDYRVGEEFFYGMVNGEEVHFQRRGDTWDTKPEGVNPMLGPRDLALTALAGDERFRPISETLKGLEVYDLQPERLRQLQKPKLGMMDPQGGNWTTVLRSLAKKEWKPEMVEVLKQLTQDIDDIRIKPVGGFLIAEFHHSQGELAGKKSPWFPANQESDGTLRVTAIMTALMQAPALSLVGIEEPELFVHVGVLGILMDYIREAEGRSQVILSTHSTEILDLLQPEEIRVVSRTEGFTRVNHMSQDQVRAVRTNLLKLGEVHRMEGLQPELAVPES